MAEIDDLRHETSDLRAQLALLKAELISVHERLGEQEKWNEQFRQRISQLFRLSVPAAAGARLVLAEVANVIKNTGQDPTSHAVLVDALTKVISEIRNGAKE